MKDANLIKLLDLKIPWSGIRLILALKDGPTHGSELSRKTGLDKAQSNRMLHRLEGFEIVKSETIGNKKFYQLNKDFFN